MRNTNRMGSRRARFAAGACALASLAVLWPSIGQAQHERDERGGHFFEPRREMGAFHGDIGRFHEHDWAIWHAGRWEHGYHGGRLGWWWVAGGIWYFYPYPIYPYPDPYVPPAVLPVAPATDAVPPPPVPSSWYYCYSGRGYYPYVPICPEGWKAVAPGTTPPPAPPPQTPH